MVDLSGETVLVDVDERRADWQADVADAVDLLLAGEASGLPGDVRLRLAEDGIAAAARLRELP